MGTLLKKLEEKTDTLHSQIEAKKEELENLKKKWQKAILKDDAWKADDLAMEIEKRQQELARLKEALSVLNSQKAKVKANEQQIQQILTEWSQRIKQGQRLHRKIEAHRKVVEKFASQLRQLHNWHDNAYWQLKQLGLEEQLPSWPVPPVDRTTEAFIKKSFSFW